MTLLIFDKVTCVLCDTVCDLSVSVGTDGIVTTVSGAIVVVGALVVLIKAMIIELKIPNSAVALEITASTAVMKAEKSVTTAGLFVKRPIS